MGAVYRARDTKLDRDVAIKVLLPDVADNPERLARFQHEAKTLAALNHPHIGHIHGLEEGPQGPFLVLELVEGPTLADRIAKGPIPIAEALSLAKQIAEALETAHEQGIIHRDLKPANVKVRPDGTVKVLDFGLAKAMEPACAQGTSAGQAHTSMSPTLTSPALMTGVGTILGTAAYMAPEQAKGTFVDKRVDIWAFGVVLHEMLTGQHLFTADTIPETLAHVMTRTADLGTLPPTTPRRVRDLIARCLEKDPRKRLRDIGEARIALDEGAQGGPLEREVGEGSRSSAIRWTIAATLGVALVAAGLMYVARERAPETQAIISTLLPPSGTEYDFGSAGNDALPALSPDGTRIVFGAHAGDGPVRLWLRRLDSAAAQPLPGTENAALPFWSPDSRWIAFGQDNRLKKIDIDGGAPAALTDLSTALRGGSWNQSGVIIFAVNDGLSPIMQVSASGGPAVPATTKGADEVAGHRYPWFLPDGRHFLYTSQQGGDIPVRVGSLDSVATPGIVVAQANSNALFNADRLLFLRRNTLVAQPFDVNSLRTTGEPAPVVEGVAVYGQPSRRAALTVSNTGLLAAQIAGETIQSRLVWKDRQGQVIGQIGDALPPIGQLALSPDGKRVAAHMVDAQGNADIWVIDTARGVRTRLTFDPALDRAPVWSPTGDTIYFRSTRKSPGELFRRSANGIGTDEPLSSDGRGEVPTSVSPDGKTLLYDRNAEQGGVDIWAIALDNPTVKPSPFLATPASEGGAKFSPDGRWVAYQSDESGRPEVYVTGFPHREGKFQISGMGGQFPLWRRDGRALFFVSLTGELLSATVIPHGNALEIGSTEKLAVGIPIGRGISYDVTADGQRFLVVDDGAVLKEPLTLLQGWVGTVRRGNNAGR
jgi:Tol biopolymer transport system component